MNKSILTQLLLSNLDSDHIGLLILIHKQGKFKPKDAVKNKLRDLRSKGLLTHDKESMTQSEVVWLTELGTEVATILMNNEFNMPSEKE